jgi:hypothetical protein
MMGNKLHAVGKRVIYVRSRRPIVTLAAAGLAGALVFGALTAVAFTAPDGSVAGFALAAGTLGGVLLAAWAGLKLKTWPSGRLGFFRDRLVMIQARHEMRALWANMETITLSEPNSWPRVRITDRLTIDLKNEPGLAFKPAHFGLDPVACRDLILRLRDDPRLRARLPEFDSVRDLAVSPIVAGELIEPRL